MLINATARTAETLIDTRLAPNLSLPSPETAGVQAVPAYLRQVYNWAYLNPLNVKLLDRELVVKVLLWGQHGRLRHAAFSEIEPGQRVYQPAHVYGDFCPSLAQHLGPTGRLEVIDVAPIQVANCRRKLRAYPWASVHCADAVQPPKGTFDVTCCYFLLHEVPDDYKRAVIDTLLDAVAPGGKAVFIDYHKPHPFHPLKIITSLVFDSLEPFAKSLWRHQIKDFASHAEHFEWRKETYFGGLFQKVVAQRESVSV